MKKLPARYEELLSYYQRWLNGYTKLSICQGMCHSLIQNSHYLMVSYIRFSSHEACQVAVIPARLYRLVYGNAYPDKLTEEGDLNLSFHIDERLLRYHPMLEGILLSECARLKQHAFANKLISLFQQFDDPEIRPKLVWLCWYDLLLGSPLDDWNHTLKLKSKEQLVEWVIDRQAENGGLTTIMDEYVLFSR
ncbi:hypothetical protein H0910_04265 [Providencia alcalifaciens]|uniref:hypothetical protein n=1 Tax=Providencia alcalifaciens TaxID=126385 RepID=UPI0015EBE21C|nr:hypothetical protein [Providencia alcalifaciens]QLQ98300.1 hypothetical protein H0910_04265 [Providencia alcalifaciens]